MDSIIFEAQSVEIPTNEEIHNSPVYLFYKIILITYNFLLAGFGGGVLLKAVFLRSVTASLSESSPLLFHSIHATMSAGVLMAVVGIVGFTCISPGGMVAYILLGTPLFVLEVGVSGALFLLESKLPALKMEIGIPCDNCKESWTYLNQLVPPAAVIILLFALMKTLIVVVVLRFLPLLLEETKPVMVDAATSPESRKEISPFHNRSSEDYAHLSISFAKKLMQTPSPRRTQRFVSTASSSTPKDNSNLVPLDLSESRISQPLMGSMGYCRSPPKWQKTSSVFKKSPNVTGKRNSGMNLVGSILRASFRRQSSQRSCHAECQTQTADGDTCCFENTLEIPSNLPCKDNFPENAIKSRTNEWHQGIPLPMSDTDSLKSPPPPPPPTPLSSNLPQFVIPIQLNFELHQLEDVTGT